MYGEKTIGVVVPVFNESKLIGRVIETMPEVVDHVIVVDDASIDGTVERVREYQASDSRLILIQREQNGGVGAAIMTGYRKAIEMKIDVTAVMAGDAQMDPNDLLHIVEPVVLDQADYTKGNRLLTGDAWKLIPKHRYLGNSVLSLLTKIASGYWRMVDSQSGYTAASLAVLKALPFNKIYPRYGFPNDLLVRLNVWGFRIKDVPTRPIYNIGERSGIKVWRVIPTISFLLFKRFLGRLVVKYVVLEAVLEFPWCGR